MAIARKDPVEKEQQAHAKERTIPGSTLIYGRSKEKSARTGSCEQAERRPDNRGTSVMVEPLSRHNHTVYGLAGGIQEME